MSLKVIGAGFGRTGTLSLKAALEELRLGPCYHMIEVNAHPEHDALWLALAKGESSDWRPMLQGYASTVDWPTTYVWKELAAANPQAKIILTLRDPDAWVRKRGGDDLRPHDRVRDTSCRGTSQRSRRNR